MLSQASTRHLDTLGNNITMFQGGHYHHVYPMAADTESLNVPNSPWLENSRTDTDFGIFYYTELEVAFAHVYFTLKSLLSFYLK